MNNIKTTWTFVVAVCAMLQTTACGCATPPAADTPSEDAGALLDAGVPDDGGNVAEDGGTLPTPSILQFASSRDAVTSGTSAQGTPKQGGTLLSWQVADAARVAVFSNDSSAPIAACDQGAGTCVAAGGVYVEPTEDTTYRLVASSTADECLFGEDGTVVDAERCVASDISITVGAPVQATLTTENASVVEGAAAVVHYAIDEAASFRVGVVKVIGGERVFVPCSDDADAPCTMPQDNGAPALEGDISFADVQAGFTVGLEATSTIDDGAGDVLPGELELNINVEGAAQVTAFAVADATVAAGDVLSFSWSTTFAEAVALSASPNNVLQADLAGCTVVDDDGNGTCTVTLDPGAPVGDIVFSLVASSDGQPNSAPSSLSVAVGERPSLTFNAHPASLPEGGGDVELAWTSDSADVVRLGVEGSDVPLLDSANATGAALCAGGAADDTCEPQSDAAVVADVVVTTHFWLEVDNEFGTTRSSLTVFVEGQPRIDAIAVDGESALDLDGQAIVLNAATASLTFDTSNTSSTTLERAASVDNGCAGVAYEAVGGFDGATSGTFALAGVDSETCFRLTALGGAEQTTAQVFRVIRLPEIHTLSSDDDTVVVGQPIALSWTADNANHLTLSVRPVGAVPADELANCGSVDDAGNGGCTVHVQPGAPLGDVTFDATAHGLQDTLSEQASFTLTLGTAPELTTFTTDMDALTEPGAVTLSWSTSDAAEVAIVDDMGADVFSSTDLAVVASGSHTIDAVSRTTTWTLTTSSAYGAAQASATTFYGPGFSSVLVGGDDDALDGVARAPTGDALVAWTTTDATSVAVDTAAPVDGGCTAVAPEGWTALSSGAANDDVAISALAEDLCVRLTAANDNQQTSEVSFLLKDMPVAGDISAAPGSMRRADGGTVIVSFAARGATDVSIVAEYLDADDELIDSDSVCNASGLNSGGLTGGVDEDEATCRDEYDAPGPFCIGCRLIPSGTATIRYRAVLLDEEGDQAEYADAPAVAVE